VPDSPQQNRQQVHVMKDVDASPEHGELTQRFVGAIVITVVAAIVALGLLAIRYGATDPTEQVILVVFVFVCLAVAIVAAVFAWRYSTRINRLSK
jgi:predicted membrane channel-forming protein YqfA (hemolysin III family)